MSKESEKKPHGLPHPLVKKMWWPYPIIWIIPLLAAAGAGYYIWAYMQDHGPEIILTFQDGSSIESGQTQVKHRGVQIGQVTEVELGAQKKDVRVHVQLERSQDDFAKSGARFWVVRPEVSIEKLSGLSTVISGPYIDSQPGTGEKETEFSGMDEPPVTIAEGLKIVLHTDHLEHLQPDSPVYFRGIQVGVVQSVDLTRDANAVDVKALIDKRFIPLVRTDSQFWIVNGIDLKGGILSGVQLKVDSLRAILSGGVAFATPDNPNPTQAADGAGFPLYDEPKKEWQTWAPKIPIGP